MEPYQRLEAEWADFNELSREGMVCCASGTAALHLALEAFQLPAGSECLVPDFTMIACARAVTLAGLTPVFVDCDERLLMDPMLVHGSVQDAYSMTGWKPGRQISAIMPVNVYGREYDVFAVRKATESYGIKVIEDLAESHGVKPSYNADAACWSFYKNKIVAGEEGGAVWFKDRKHADLARQLRCLGFTEAHDFRHVPRGHNYRMSNLHAELVLRSVRAYGGEVNGQRVGNHYWRRQIESWYDEHCPDEWRMPPRDAPWVYDIRNPQWARIGITNVIKALNDAGIRARHSFIPMSRQSEYLDCRLVKREKRDQESELPLVARSWVASTEVLYLPIQPGVTTEEDCRRAFEVLRGIVG